MIQSYKDDNFVTIATWYYERGLEIPKQEKIPKHGWIIDNKLAVFLVETDTFYCLLEYYISDPKTDKKERIELSDTLLNFVENQAKLMGYTRIINIVTHPGSLNVLDRNKFIEKPTNLLMKDI